MDEFLISPHLVPWMGRTEDLTGASRPDTLLNYLGTHPSYAFSDAYADVWRPEVRRLTLVRLYAVIERARKAGLKLPEALPLLVIKEVNGSHAADFVMSLFPRSRMLVLLRDPRDVLDSLLDAQRSGGWLADARPLAAVDGESERLNGWRAPAATGWRSSAEERLRSARSGPQEGASLRASPRRHGRGAGSPPRLAGLAAERQRVETIAERHSFVFRAGEAERAREALPAAQPGGWRTSLSGAEKEVADRILEPALTELGYEA